MLNYFWITSQRITLKFQILTKPTLKRKIINMNMFSKMTTDGMAPEEDRLGGFQVLPTDIYKGVMEVVYAVKSKSSDSQGLHFSFKSDDGKVFKDTAYITNRNNENFYIDKKDKVTKHLLPSWLDMDSLCLMATGLPLTEQETEQKTVNVWNFDLKKDVPTEVTAFTGLTGKRIAIAIQESTVDVTKKNDAMKWVPNGETKNENSVAKFFHEESMRTSSEVMTGQEDSIFAPKWLEKNQGKVHNKAKGAQGTAGVPGAVAKAGAGAAAPKQSLFGPK